MCSYRLGIQGMLLAALLLCASVLRPWSGRAAEPAPDTAIRGTLTIPPQWDRSLRITKVGLVNREVKQEYVQNFVKVEELKAEYEPQSGAFKVTGLKPDNPYDFLVVLSDGTRMEGVDLTPRIKDRDPLPLDARAYMQKHFYEMLAFDNERRILAYQGNGLSATALVELARTSAFNDSGGDVIWRTELWFYEESFGGWKCLTQQKVLHRVRMKGKDWANWKWLYVPAWGGLLPGAKEYALTMPPFTGLSPEMNGRHPKFKPLALKPEEDFKATKKQHVEDVHSEKDKDLGPPEQ